MTDTKSPDVWDSGTAPHASLVEALAAFHADAPTVIKDATAKVTGENKATGEKIKYTYGYADLATVTEALNPLLGKHGLAFTSKPTMTEQGFGLVYALKHESGEVDEGFWPLPDPTRMKPQDLGSWITYWRRYAFLAITNTFPGGEDDDGQKAQQAPRDSWESAKPARRPVDDRQAQAGQEPQAAPASAAPKTSWTDDEVLKLVKPMPTAHIEKAIEVYDWMAGKNLHKRTVEMDYQGHPVKVTATDLVAGRLADEAMAKHATIETVKSLQAVATNRGLMKVQVSDSETLAEALFSAQELAVHAAAEKAAGK